ncbi:MAG: TonB-dependent receptor [Chloroflexi bacterium]|nr:TonB-dependent receptor [Chloroflexota bacterium]
MLRAVVGVILVFVTASLASAQTVSGTISDPTGAPLAGATVILIPESGRPPAARTTDQSGRFDLESSASGRVTLVVSKAGFAEHREVLDLAEQDERMVTITLALSTFAEDVHVAAALGDVASISSRLVLTRLATPASVDVVTQEVIQARGADTASTALRHVTGVTSSLRPGASAVFSSRGFIENSLGILFNGVRVQSATVTMRNYDAFNFDRVEVLRGPASVLHGEGSAAGAINFVRREPVPGRTRVEGLLEVGAADRVRVGAAAAGSIGASSTYTVSFARNRFDTHVDGNTHAYTHLTGGVRTTLGRVSFGIEGDVLSNSVDDPYWGTPLIDGRIDAQLYGLNFNRSDNNRYDDTVWWGRLTAAAPDHGVWGTRHDAAFDFSVGRHRGRAVVGGDLAVTDFSSPRSYGPRVSVDAFAPESLAFDAPDRLDDRRADLRQVAAYGELNLDLVDRLTVVAGGRVGRLSNAIARPASGVAFDQSFAPRDGRVGLVFAATPSVAAYTQFATGSEPIEALLILGPAESGFRLAHASLWEGGLKATASEGRIDLTAAVYHLAKRDLTTTDPEDSTRTVQIGEQSSRGVELSLVARPIQTLLVEANVAALEARYDVFFEGTASRNGNLPPNVPEVVFNLGTTWRPISRVETGFWLTRVGRRAADATNTVFQEAYTLIDPFARVSFGPRADLTLRVRNAANERYVEWATRAFGVTNVYFGEPRRIVLSLRLRM